MSGVLTVFRREIAAYFNAAIAYIFIIVFVLLNGGLYMTQFFLVGLADMRPFFGMLPFLLAVFLPAVTMRLWAEEKRGNTLELLLTFPMGTHKLVFGKFLASLAFYLAALACTLTIPVMLNALGQPDRGVILGGYIGSALLGAFFLSLGIFISGLCRDQIVAFILAMLVCFGLHLAGTEFIASSIDGWVPGLGSFLQRFLGSSVHYDSFARGVLDNRDILYFAGGSLIFLVLNGFWLEGRMRPGAKKIFSAAVLVSVAIFFLGNWLFSELPLGRHDLTEGRIYTISPASKKILAGLKAPVYAKFYVSPADKMPTGMKTLEQDVLDKLEELKISAGGKFQYKVFHMEAANVVEGGQKAEESLEQQLQRKGIEPYQVRAIESDEVVVRLVYSSLTLAYKEKPEDIVPRIGPDNLNELEYMLMSKIYRLTLPETPRVALLAPFEDRNVDPQLAGLLSQLGGQAPDSFREDLYEVLPLALEYDGYKVSRIKLTEAEPLPEGVKTLIVLEPGKLDERQKYEISRFLRGGGSLFMGVQLYMYDYQATGTDLKITSISKGTNANSLLSSWGLEVDEQILVDQQHDVINIGGGARMGPFEVSVPVKVPIQIIIPQTGMNPDVSITSRLSPLFYLWGTALKVDEEKVKTQGLKVETLLRSSPVSWSVPFQPVLTGPESLGKTAESRTGPFPLAVLAQGQFADPFEGQTVPPWTAAPAPAGEAKKDEGAPAPVTPAPGKLLLTGASTMFQKHLVKGGGHLNFFMNAVDALTLGDELVTIRSKQPIDRSVGRISAAAKLGWRFFVMLLIPVIIALIGSFRVLLRRQAKAHYLKNLASAHP